jgi:hypothetical protein
MARRRRRTNLLTIMGRAMPLGGQPFIRAPRPSFDAIRHRPWWQRWFAVLVAIVILALAPIVAHAQEADSVVVSWTAPGDDGNVGTAARYDLRFSESPITAENFAAAAPVSGMPDPLRSGRRQRVTVRSLTHGTTYYFAMRTADDAGNWSSVSNVVRWEWILDTSPPSAPHGPKADKNGEAVRVSWNVGTEADLLGYRVYRALGPGGTFTQLTSTPVADTVYDDDTIPEGATEVAYQITATDLNGNESPHSATATLELILPTPPASPITVEEAYPNPSRAQTPVKVPVVIAPGGATRAMFEVIDSGGRRVRRIEIEGLAPGRTEIVWDGRNDVGYPVAPGVYRGWLIAGGTRQSVRLLRVP